MNFFNDTKIKVCIVGLGKMGKIHLKYVKQLGVEWYWSDVSRNINGVSKSNFLDIDQFDKIGITHVIISTPEKTHFEIYESINRKNPGNNFFYMIEKPAVIARENLNILERDNVSTGMVERFNPAISSLRNVINGSDVLSIDFVRCSARPLSNTDVSSFIDVGIHDIDLFNFVLENPEIINKNIMINSDTFCLNMQLKSGAVARFIWSNETFYKERKVFVREKGCCIEADLISQTLNRYSIASENNPINTTQEIYVEKSSPILLEILNFLNSNKVDAKSSHELYFDVIDMIN